ncbi:DUF6093 family protein [Streptomyces sp. NPDC001984]
MPYFRLHPAPKPSQLILKPAVSGLGGKVLRPVLRLTTARASSLRPEAARLTAAAREDRVRVVASTQDPGLLNRTWRVLDISDANSLAVVRTTRLDEVTQAAVV